MRYSKIKKIESAKSEPIYHLTVEKNHNFFANDLLVHNCGYRGEVQVTFNRTEVHYSNGNIYEIGDKVAQMVILPYPQIALVETDELSETDRGTGGFGSTGK